MRKLSGSWIVGEFVVVVGALTGGSVVVSVALVTVGASVSGESGFRHGHGIFPPVALTCCR